MRRSLPFLIFLLIIFSSCNQTNNPVVAEAFHHRLFLSEVIEKIPSAASKEDSLLFFEQYVNDWILHQTLLAHAKKNLTNKEQEFSSQIAQYKDKLLINEYLHKISSEKNKFVVFNDELHEFLSNTKTDKLPQYRDMVKLNYVKLSNPSKLYQKIKVLFFDENDRIKALQQLELICADSIEYYLDDEHWFHTDFIEKELPFTFSNKEFTKPGDKFDFVQDEYRYLVIILDKKQQLQTQNILEDRKIAISLIQQQKRAEFISNHKNSLVEKAFQDKKAVRYPINEFANY